MTDDRKRERLFQQLWPCPEPPPDLAGRVLAALANQRGAAGEAGKDRMKGAAGTADQTRAEARLKAQVLALAEAGRRLEARRRRRRGVLLGSAGLAAALAAAMVVMWRAGGDAGTGPAVLTAADPAQGHELARTRTTVNIARRAAAAMEPGAQLTWAVQKKRVRVDQRRGSVFYRVDRGGPFQVSTPAGQVEVTGTCFRVTLGPAAGAVSGSATLVSVLEGSVKVTSGPGTSALTVQAGETVRLQTGHAPRHLPAAAGDDPAAHERQLSQPPAGEPESAGAETPTPGRRSSVGALLLPASTRLRVHGRRIGQVSLTVPVRARSRGPALARLASASAPASVSAVDVEVARDPAFRRRVYSGPAPGGQVTVPAPSRGHLYWRSPGGGPLLGHARFLPEGRRGRVRLPHNLVTEGAESTSIYFQSAPPAITLAFSPTAGAAGYRVRVQRTGAQDGEVVFQRLVERPQVVVRSGALGEGQYQWSAQPLDAHGEPLGTTARLNRLQLAYDNALDALAIASPQPNQKLKGRAVDVQGVAPLGSRLYVNGTLAPVDEKGRFALKLPGRPRTLVFRVLARDGSESYWLRKLAPRS